MRQLLCKDGSGKEFRITIPDGAIVTFAPAIPGGSQTPRSVGYGDTGREYALRVYRAPKNESNILAVFTNVRSFRDMKEIQVEQLVIREEGKSVWKSDEEGFKVETAVKKDAKFVDSLHLLEANNQEEEF